MRERSCRPLRTVNHLVWRKSSYSASQTACVEVAWRKSSYSGNQTDCVEVARPVEGMAVRDSKNPGGPVLTFGRPAFAAFLSTVAATRG